MPHPSLFLTPAFISVRGLRVFKQGKVSALARDIVASSFCITLFSEKKLWESVIQQLLGDPDKEWLVEAHEDGGLIAEERQDLSGLVRKLAL